MADSRTTGAIGGIAQGAATGSAFGPIGTAVGAVAGGLLGAFGGGGEDAAKSLAKTQERMLEMATDENLRRMDLARGRAMGQSQAAIGASNLQFSGSPMQYAQQIDEQYLQDMAWESMKSKIEARTLRKGGSIAADQISTMGYQNMIAGIGMAARTFGRPSGVKTDGTTT